jgi:hypothetical protein
VVTVEWVVPPTALAPALDIYQTRVSAAIMAVAQFIAQKMQDEARQGASWTDRTGDARSGLLGQVEQASAELVHLYLVHTMFYGLFLELKNGGRYSIIMPTIERNIPVIEKMLKDIFD